MYVHTCFISYTLYCNLYKMYVCVFTHPVQMYHTICDGCFVWCVLLLASEEGGDKIES